MLNLLRRNINKIKKEHKGIYFIISMFPIIKLMDDCIVYCLENDIKFKVFLYVTKIDKNANISGSKRSLLEAHPEIQQKNIIIIKEPKEVWEHFGTEKKMYVGCGSDCYQEFLDAGMTDRRNIFSLLTPPSSTIEISRYQPGQAVKKLAKKLREARPERNTSKYKKWRRGVFERDNYTCAITGKQGGRLEAHHIRRWADYPELRYCVSNGITLSAEAHQNINGREANYESFFLEAAKKNRQNKKPKKNKPNRRKLKGSLWGM